jgi:hypothetical protein
MILLAVVPKSKGAILKNNRLLFPAKFFNPLLFNIIWKLQSISTIVEPVISIMCKWPLEMANTDDTLVIQEIKKLEIEFNLRLRQLASSIPNTEIHIANINHPKFSGDKSTAFITIWGIRRRTLLALFSYINI